tara:strand:- start:3692 stop:4183 length:492 start_codon:yes stop_codon:yes gene_type:complete
MKKKILITLFFLSYNAICYGFSNQYEAKAAWVNFIFQNIQTNHNNKNLICTLGLDSVGLFLKDNNNIKEKIIDENFHNCRVLYISNSEENNITDILRITNKSEIITISDIERFLSYGGSIKLNIQNNRIHLYLNKTNIFNLESKGWIIDSNIKNMSTTYEQNE